MLKAFFNFKLFIALFISSALSAQIVEEVVPLQAMPMGQAPTFKTAGDTIELPIRDDFSAKRTFPNPDFWADRFVFISSTIPAGPLSIGAAVFDGTDENGFPYNLANNTSDSIADVLTSHFIDFVGPPQNLYLSFVYQRAGNGDVPEITDSLAVQFWAPTDSTWNQVWAVGGSGLADNFKSIILPVDDPKFLVDGFRFRFAARGAQNGVFDIWNIDYVELDINRNVNDTLISEPAFVRQHPFILRNHTHIPWFHYNDQQLLSDVTLTYRRNGFAPGGGWSLNLGKYTIKKDGALVKDRLTVPVITNNIQNIDLDFSVPLQPLSLVPAAGEFTVEMRTWFDGTAEGLRSNDTVEVSIPFKNYYAFDDGTAEQAYGILNQTNAHFAIQLQPIQPDSLRGLFINFAHGGTDATLNSFKIAVWSFNNGVPGPAIYVSDSIYTPVYGYYHNDFMPFELDEAVYLPGAVFIGIIQTNATAIHMGLDINTPNATPKYYGNGFIWYQSLVPSTVMLRPYLRYTPTNFGTAENVLENIKVYPNPAQTLLNIASADKEDLAWTLLNTTGQIVANGTERQVDVADLPRGLYILRLSQKGNVAHQKIILH
jgi:hypothetical protein